MTDFTLTLNNREAHDILVGVTKWSSTEPARLVLTAVAFGLDAVWATDSYKMCRLPYDRFTGQQVEPDTIRLVNGGRLRWALGRYSSTDKATLLFGAEGVDVRRSGVAVHITYTEGTYPDVFERWGRLSTGPSAGDPAALNLVHLSAVQHLAPKGMGLVIPNGLGAARVVDDRYDEPIGIVVPVRANDHGDLLDAAVAKEAA